MRSSEFTTANPIAIALCVLSGQFKDPLINVSDALFPLAPYRASFGNMSLQPHR
jgi:hypothetical protein